MIYEIYFLEERTLTDSDTGETRTEEQTLSRVYLVPDRLDFIEEETGKGKKTRGYLRLTVHNLGLWQRVKTATRIKITLKGKYPQEVMTFAIRSVSFSGPQVTIEAETI